MSDDKDKSVEEWLNETKLSLFNKCVELGLTSTGTKDILASRLYDHYHTTPNQPSQTSNVTSNVDSANQPSPSTDLLLQSISALHSKLDDIQTQVSLNTNILNLRDTPASTPNLPPPNNVNQMFTQPQPLPSTSTSSLSPTLPLVLPSSAAPTLGFNGQQWIQQTTGTQNNLNLSLTSRAKLNHCTTVFSR